MTTTTEQHEQDAAKRYDAAVVEADPAVPTIHIRRDFHASRAQLFRAHTEPGLFARWIGPKEFENEITEWDARDGGAWAYTARHGDFEGSFRGCFHTVREDRIVQTFTWDGMPDAVSLETLTFTDLGGGRTRLHAVSLCDSFEARDQWLASGMEHGVEEGYDSLERLATGGEL
ncbi:SRPBCC domain-containing protein [Nocardioides sp. SYSU D00065]|uniref:SRPBCC domain-containing protein n=1 Tax=Nocardioides sp. SYSU D00065 TaxID=2817378 RepID=UPI001B344731|nr:SRPBCC domain-containing protein [Nocardioides sp. SYSU D00065]